MRTQLSFEDIFAFSPRALQQEFYSSVKAPGLYILEAPMGLGKTEAALYATYKLLEQSKANGIYFALPTQLTSEKIHERMGDFLSKIIIDKKNSQNMLLHGKAWLKSYGLIAFDEDENLDYSWFASKKKALLAPFGVGTIDQALMSVINVKHASVRTFGLAGKVVILDEVHSYDMYTGTLINELIKSLLALGCTVIILSATLTQKRRKSLFPEEISQQVQENSYPLISAYTPENKNIIEIATENSLEEKEVDIHILHDTDIAIEKALSSAENGSQVLWIENTIDDAQKRYKEIMAISQGIGIEIGLLHSRFTQFDRDKIEDKWIELYDKNSLLRKEKGRILIGTQVLEQSIDIDADILFTSFCPTDMLFQRLGRLHRHKETIRPPHVKCEAYILCPSSEELNTKGIEAFGKNIYVYDPYILLRSLEVWNNKKKISLPYSIRPFLEMTYEDRKEERESKHNMAFLKAKLLEEKERFEKLALYSATRNVKPLNDETATTRINERPQKEILLLKKYFSENEKITLLAYSGEICYHQDKLTLEESKKISSLLMASTVKVPEYAFSYNKKKDFEQLCKFSGGIESCVLVREDGSISNANENYTLHYSPKLGLTITKTKE